MALGLRVKEAPALTWASGPVAFHHFPFQVSGLSLGAGCPNT